MKSSVPRPQAAQKGGRVSVFCLASWCHRRGGVGSARGTNSQRRAPERYPQQAHHNKTLNRRLDRSHFLPHFTRAKFTVGRMFPTEHERTVEVAPEGDFWGRCHTNWTCVNSAVPMWESIGNNNAIGKIGFRMTYCILFNVAHLSWKVATLFTAMFKLGYPPFARIGKASAFFSKIPIPTGNSRKPFQVNCQHVKVIDNGWRHHDVNHWLVDYSFEAQRLALWTSPSQVFFSLDGDGTFTPPTSFHWTA